MGIPWNFSQNELSGDFIAETDMDMGCYFEVDIPEYKLTYLFKILTDSTTYFVLEDNTFTTFVNLR